MTSHQSKAKQKYDTAYEARPEQVKKRMMRNEARAALEKKGVVSKGDGKDVDHKRPLGAGGGNSADNLRAITEKQNRGWRRGESSYKPKKV